MALPTCGPCAEPPPRAISTEHFCIRYPGLGWNKRQAGGGRAGVWRLGSAWRCRQTAGAHTQPGLCLLCAVLLKHVAIEIPEHHVSKIFIPPAQIASRGAGSQAETRIYLASPCGFASPCCHGRARSSRKEEPRAQGSLPGLEGPHKVIPSVSTP